VGMRKTSQGLRVTAESLVILESDISRIKPQNHNQSCRRFGQKLLPGISQTQLHPPWRYYDANNTVTTNKSIYFSSGV
jgi:hypothetical protein